MLGGEGYEGGGDGGVAGGVRVGGGADAVVGGKVCEGLLVLGRVDAEAEDVRVVAGGGRGRDGDVSLEAAGAEVVEMRVDVEVHALGALVALSGRVVVEEALEGEADHLPPTVLVDDRLEARGGVRVDEARLGDDDDEAFCAGEGAELVRLRQAANGVSSRFLPSSRIGNPVRTFFMRPALRLVNETCRFDLLSM